METRGMGIAAALALVAATGCTPSGELGNGSFHYVCTSDHDYGCRQGWGSPDGRVVAIEANFGMQYDLSSFDEDPTIAVGPASFDVVGRALGGGGFRFVRGGEGALLAVDGQGRVRDFIHLYAAEATAIDLRVERETIGLGDQVDVVAYPMTQEGVHLYGAMSCSWSSPDTQLAFSNECGITVRGDAPGALSIEVKMGNAVAQTTIMVEEDAL